MAALIAAVVVFPLAAWVLRAHMQRAAVAALVSNATMGAEAVQARVDDLRTSLERVAPACSRRLLDDPPQSPRLERMLDALLAATPRLSAIAVVGPVARMTFAIAPDADGFDPQVWFGRGAPRTLPLAMRGAADEPTQLWLPLSVSGEADVRIVGIVDSTQLLPRTSPTRDGECMRLALPTATAHATPRAPGADLRLELDDRAEYAALRVELPNAERALERMTAAVTTPLVALGALLVLSFGLAARLCLGARVRAVGERREKARRVWLGPRTAQHATTRDATAIVVPRLVKLPPAEIADSEHAAPARVGGDEPDLTV